MAGAGAPFYMPAFWPLGNLAYTLSTPKNDQPPPNKTMPYLDIWGHLTAMIAATRSFGLAWLCMFYLPGMIGQQYPAFGPAKQLSWSWMGPIVLRNLAATWIICGFWDWFLYFSPLKEKLHKYKMNPVYPSMEQFKHDAFFTSLASCLAAVLEIGLCHSWATGQLVMQRHLSDAPLLNIFLAVTVSHWRIPHFYLTHRLMHPWRTISVPDLGKFLYRKVHSLHHKSYNPTAFSGTNMHPAEAFLYYTAALIPVAFGLHPIHALAAIVDCGVGAWLGHDGFQWPGTGNYFHFLHHKHFDCNYGGMHVPLDWLFGTYAAGKEDIGKIWRSEHVGEEANSMPVHPPSSNQEKVE